MISWWFGVGERNEIEIVSGSSALLVDSGVSEHVFLSVNLSLLVLGINHISVTPYTNFIYTSFSLAQPILYASSLSANSLSQ